MTHPPDSSRIVVAVDPAGCAMDVCAHAATLAVALRARVTLLHVVHEPPGVPAQAQLVDTLGVPHAARELLDDAAAHELAALARTFQDAGCPVDVVVRHGAPAPTILDEARTSHARLLVMGTHGRTGARHLLFGSVAERVLRKAPCPVVVVRAPTGMVDAPSELEQAIAAETMG